MTLPLHSKKLSENGIGLIHVLFFLLLITLTLAVSVSLLEPAQNASATSQTQEKLDQLKAAITRYRGDSGSNPPNLDALVTQTGAACSADTNPSSSTFKKLKGWCGPYMRQEFSGSISYKQDGWNSLLQYNGTTIVSCGENRNCGDTDDISITL